MNKKKQESRSLKISILTRIFIFILSLFLGFILLLFVTLSIKPTRILIANLGLEILNKNLNGKVSVADLRFNPFTGVVINDLLISVDGDTLLFLPKTYIDWDFAPILERKLFIKISHLENPKIKLIRRFGDEMWNFEKLFPTSSDTVAKPLNLLVYLERLEIENGNFIYSDFNHSPTKNKFDASAISLTKISLSINGMLNLKNSIFAISIKQFKCFENRIGLDIQNLACKVNIDTNKIQIHNLAINTSQSQISCSAVVNFSKNDKSNKKITIEFEPSKVNTTDIMHFAPNIFSKDNKIEFIGTVSIIPNIEFNNFRLKFLSSQISCNGKITLPNGKNLSPYVFVFIPKGYVIYKEIRNILKPIFPELPLNFSKLILNKINVAFADSTIKVDGRVSSDFGNISTRFSFNLAGETETKIAFEKLDLAFLQNFPSISTSMKGEIEAKLNLLNFEHSSGSARIRIDSCNFQEYPFGLRHFDAEVTINNGKINFDTLQTLIKYNNSNQESKISFSGAFQLQNSKIEEYFGKLNVEKLDLQTSLSNKKFPTSVSGNIIFKGKEFDPNRMIIDLSSNFEEFTFTDRVLFPFSLSLSINHNDEDKKWIKVNSELFKIEISGKYEFLSLIENFADQFFILQKSFIDKFKVFQSKDTTGKFLGPIFSEKAKPFPNFSFVADIKILDFSLIASFFNLDLNFAGFARFKYVSGDSTSRLDLDTFGINYLTFLVGGNSFNLMNFSILGDYSLSIHNTSLSLDYVKLRSFTNSKFVLSGNVFNYLDLSLNLSNEQLEYNLETSYQGTIELVSNGTISFTPDKIKLVSPLLQIAYNKVFKWQVADSLRLEIDRDGYKILPFTLLRENAETINILGSLDYQNTIYSTILINNVPLNDFQKLVPNENSLSKIRNFEGEINQLKIIISQTLDRPKILASLNAQKLKFEDSFIGNILANLEYNNENIFGEASLIQDGHKVLDLIVQNMPFKIDLENMLFFMQKDKLFESNLIAENFPLIVISPFIEKWVEQIKGSANINVSIEGFPPDQFFFNGTLDILPSIFKLKANNLTYLCEGNLVLNEETLEINGIKIRNDKSDMTSGEGMLFGKINFERNNFSDLSLKFVSSGIKVLSRASAKVKPELFGDLIIATGNKGVNIHINHEETKIEGDINILKGKLIMPSTTINQSVSQSLVRYEFSGKEIKIIDENIDTISSRLQTRNVENNNTQKIGNLIIDLFIGIVNPIEVTLDITTIGQIFALITLSDQRSLLHYYSDSKNNLTLVTGSDLVLQEGSTLKFIKIFKTSGTIIFPVGSFENPGLNIKAEYTGQSIYNDAVRNYTVTIYLTGTKENPKLRFEYTIDNQAARGDTSRITQDALFLLAFGRTRTEMEKGNGSAINLDEFSTSGGSAILSKLLSDALMGTGFISSADISFGSSTASSFDKAKLRMTGNFLGLTWNFGGTVADLMNNSELTVEIPFGLIFRPEILRNFFVQLSRTTNMNQTPQPNQKDWEVKLRYGTSW